MIETHLWLLTWGFVWKTRCNASTFKMSRPASFLVLVSQFWKQYPQFWHVLFVSKRFLTGTKFGTQTTYYVESIFNITGGLAFFFLIGPTDHRLGDYMSCSLWTLWLFLRLSYIAVCAVGFVFSGKKALLDVLFAYFYPFPFPRLCRLDFSMSASIQSHS